MRTHRTAEDKIPRHVLSLMEDTACASSLLVSSIATFCKFAVLRCTSKYYIRLLGDVHVRILCVCPSSLSLLHVFGNDIFFVSWFCRCWFERRKLPSSFLATTVMAVPVYVTDLPVAWSLAITEGRKIVTKGCCYCLCRRRHEVSEAATVPGEARHMGFIWYHACTYFAFVLLCGTCLAFFLFCVFYFRLLFPPLKARYVPGSS